MTAKEYLQQPHLIDRKIKLDIQELETLWADNKLTACYELVVQIDTEICQLVEKWLEIEKVINAVPDFDQWEILTRRYLLYQKWELLATEMDINKSYVHRLHNKALSKISVP